MKNTANNNKHIIHVIINYTVLGLIGLFLLFCITALCISLVMYIKSADNHVYRGIIVGKEYVPNHKYYRCVGKVITTHEVDDQYVITILGEEVDSDGLITDTEELKTEKWCVSRDTYNKYNLDDEIDMLDIPDRREFDDN